MSGHGVTTLENEDLRPQDPVFEFVVRKRRPPVLVFVVRKRSEDPVKQKTVQKIITSLTHITAATTLSNIMHLSIETPIPHPGEVWGIDGGY